MPEYRPRRFITDVSDTSDDEQPVLHLNTCPFCRADVEGEPGFRRHLPECDEAPRSPDLSVPDWRDALSSRVDPLATEPDAVVTDDADDDRLGDRPDDAPGEVLPV